MAAPNRIDLTGRTFGDLTVIRHSHTAHGRAFWVCNCDCGWMGVVVEGTRMLKGQKKACGIEGHRWVGPRYTGLSRTGTYKVWCGMRDRCYRTKNARFSDYGGRGIGVCERWRDSFPNFLADMGKRPNGGFTIERKDVNGNYEPANCIWLPKNDQARNTRRSIFVDYQGETLLLTDLCDKLGLDRHVMHARIRQHNWLLEEGYFRANPSLH